MSYQTKFVRREVKSRRIHRSGLILLELECGHGIVTKRWWVQRPICEKCNQVAAALGRAERRL